MFDDDCDGLIDSRELVIGLETFKESSIEQKLRVIIDLCETNKNNEVSQDDLFNLLKKNVQSSQEKRKLIQISNLFPLKST